jgi:hypothetical protein
MEIPRQLTTLGCLFGLSWTSVLPAAETPGPRPTPKPGTLAAIACSRSLNRAPELDQTGVIVITDDNLDQLGRDATLTLLTSTIADSSVVETNHSADPKTREKWRKKVLAQSSVIARLEARRNDAEEELNRLERGKLDSRTLDRIAKAESKLQTIDAEIRSEKAQLSTIIREARKEGAQPGWFR